MPAKLIQYPKGPVSLMEAKDGRNESHTYHTLSCTATLDHRTEKAYILWYYTKGGETVQVTGSNNAAVQVKS